MDENLSRLALLVGEESLERIRGKNVLLCGCGDTGCFEAYVSGPSIVAMAKDYVKGKSWCDCRENLGNTEWM